MTDRDHFSERLLRMGVEMLHEIGANVGAQNDPKSDPKSVRAGTERPGDIRDEVWWRMKAESERDAALARVSELEAAFKSVDGSLGGCGRLLDAAENRVRELEGAIEEARLERDQQERFKFRANERADHYETALREIAEDTDHPSWRKAKATARAALSSEQGLEGEGG